MLAKRNTLSIIVLILITAALLFVVSRLAPGPGPISDVAAGRVLAQPAAQESDPPSDVPPTLVESDPPAGAAWNGQPVRLLFDQEMGPAAAESLQVEPELAGAATVEGAAVIFTPEAKPEPGVRYTVRLAAAATSATGVALNAPVELEVVGASPLVVTSTQPSDGATEVSTAGQIVVVFNRPVTPLSGVDDQADLPQPLEITPAVEGSGQWLNTSIYVFEPELGLAGATDYTVTVDGITGLAGESLEEPVTFSFSTASPLVTEATPAGEKIRPDAKVQVTFSQPMDPAGTEAAFELVHLDGSGAVVPGSFDWNETSTGFTFTPESDLAFGGTHEIRVGVGAQPASRQGTLREPFSQRFVVVPLPAVESFSPDDDATGVDPERTVVIRFNAPVSRTLVLDNIHVSPVISTTQVYSYYSDYDSEVRISWFKEPQTTYTVTVDADIADEYGNTLGQETDFQFTTGDYAPFTRINLEQFTHFSAYSTTLVSTYHRNMPEYDVALYRLPLEEFYRLTGENRWQAWNEYQMPDQAANLIWTRTYTATVGPNVVGEQLVALNDADGEMLPPGIYLLEMEKPEQPVAEGEPPGPTREMKVIVLSNYNLVLKRSYQGNSLAWLTHVRSGEPEAGVPVSFLLRGEELAAPAPTDANGLVTANLGLAEEDNWVPVLAMAGQPGDDQFAIVSQEWSQGIGPWEWNISQGPSNRYQTFFYTERPIYRPGQTVHWKGIIRRLDDAGYQLPGTDLPIYITVRDGMGNVVQQVTVNPSANGTVVGQLDLADEAATGFYFLEARIELGPDRSIYSGTGFQVASYRKPEFEISVQPAAPEYTQGETVQVTVQANYFSGGPLGDAPVTWRVIAEPYTFNWGAQPEGRYFSFRAYDPEEYSYDPYRGGYYGGLVQEGSGRTNPDGSFTLELPADLMEAPASQTWAMDFTVQSPTNQFVSGRASVVIHQADFYIGLSPRSNVVEVGDESVVDVVTVAATGAPDNPPYPAAALDVVIYAFAWNSVQERGADGSFYWTTQVERTALYTTSVTTDRAGVAEIRWTPQAGGQYQVVAQGADDAGHPVSSAAFFFVSTRQPGDFVAWPQENNDRMDLVADKQLYTPGEVARVLVPSPFTGPVQALVTYEKSGVIFSDVVTLAGNSETLEVPITSEMIPNVYVSVVVVKGVDESNPTPAMRVGYVELPVDVSEKELSMDVETSAATVAPGDTVSYTLRVADAAGAAVSGVEVSVAVVDKAVLALAADGNQSLMDAFYAKRPLGVQTGALLVINRDRLSLQLSDGAKGGGGGGGMEGMEIRQEFPDIAFWRADLITDEAGEIDFAVTLPDNLTTWRMVSRAVSPETLVGEATHDVVATKELQVRPLLPRFFTAGDRARIGAVVINTSDRPVAEGRLQVAISGATLETDVAEYAFELAPGEQSRFEFPVAVERTAAQVEVTFAATSSTLDDAVRITLPVNRYSTPEVVGTAGVVPAEGRVEAIRIPAEATDEGELRVVMEPSLAAGMVDSLTYLEHFPYECNEQTVSRFLPNLFTSQALQALDLEDREVETQLAYQIGVGVQRLVSRQNGDGGWGYWPGQESSPFVSAYVLWGLATAGQLDFTVPGTALENGVRYLERQFAAPDDVTDNWRLNEMAFMHFVLAEMGQGDPGRAATLWDARERLGHYGRAYLAMALAAMSEEGADPRVDTLLDDLYGAAQFSATGAFWQEAEQDWWTFNTDLRSTAVVLAAFNRLDPDQPMLAQVVRWLMSAREAGRWSTTQENAWSLVALTGWMANSGELQGEYAWSVMLNDEELGTGTVDAENLDERVTLRTAVADMLRDQTNVLRFDRSNDSGQLYYTAHLEYYLDALAVEARDRGMVVDRRFELAEERVNSAAVGDVISVTVTLVAPTNLYHTMVEVPIPAGTEPVDPSLATESSQFGGPEFGPVEADGDQPGRRAWTPTYTDIRDDKVALFATWLPAGAYEYTFQVRAAVPGEYRVLPVYGEQMYFPEVWGRSAGALFTVTE